MTGDQIIEHARRGGYHVIVTEVMVTEALARISSPFTCRDVVEAIPRDDRGATVSEHLVALWLEDLIRRCRAKGMGLMFDLVSILAGFYFFDLRHDARGLGGSGRLLLLGKQLFFHRRITLSIVRNLCGVNSLFFPCPDDVGPDLGRDIPIRDNLRGVGKVLCSW